MYNIKYDQDRVVSYPTLMFALARALRMRTDVVIVNERNEVLFKKIGKIVFTYH